MIQTRTPGRDPPKRSPAPDDLYESQRVDHVGWPLINQGGRQLAHFCLRRSQLKDQQSGGYRVNRVEEGVDATPAKRRLLGGSKRRKPTCEGIHDRTTINDHGRTIVLVGSHLANVAATSRSRDRMDPQGLQVTRRLPHRRSGPG